MPRFQLTAPRACVFEIGDRRYDVPVGGVVEIPDELTFVIERRGLPLVAAPDAEGPTARVVLEGKPSAALLAQIPAERRGDLLRAWESCATQAERSALVREVLQWLADSAARRVAAEDDEPDEPDAEESPAAPPAASEDDVDAQIAAVKPRGRRRKKD